MRIYSCRRGKPSKNRRCGAIARHRRIFGFGIGFSHFNARYGNQGARATCSARSNTDISQPWDLICTRDCWTKPCGKSRAMRPNPRLNQKYRYLSRRIFRTTIFRIADQKMQFYQRLGQIRQTVEVLAIEEELADRFGPLPEPTAALLDILQVKILARQLRLSQLQIGQTMTMTLSPDKPLMRTDIERMVTQSPLPLEFAPGRTAKNRSRAHWKGAAIAATIGQKCVAEPNLKAYILITRNLFYCQ